MNRRIFVFTLCSLWTPFSGVAQDAGSNTNASRLQVVVKYTGAGQVDSAHKLYVVLWDSPDFVKDDYHGPNPFAVKPTEAKNGMVTFDQVAKKTVYVSLAYDPSGKWQGDVEPPAGASLGFYGMEAGKPMAVDLKPGKTVKILAPLDDSYKNPEKKSK